MRLRLARVAVVCAAASLVFFALYAVFTVSAPGYEGGEHGKIKTKPTVADSSTTVNAIRSRQPRADDRHQNADLIDDTRGLEDMFLFVAVFSSHGGRARRDAIRQSWAKEQR